MSTEAAHKSWWQTSEVVFGIPFLLAILLQRVAPLRLPRRPLAPVVITVGAVLMLVGVALIIFARREFAQHGQRTDPGYPTTNIVTTGVFSISRNPLYLGVVCVLIGIALAFYFLWGLLLLLPSLAACHYILIAPEEKYLAARFDGEYRQYMDSVHRWIGRARRLK